MHRKNGMNPIEMSRWTLTVAASKLVTPHTQRVGFGDGERTGNAPAIVPTIQMITTKILHFPFVIILGYFNGLVTATYLLKKGGGRWKEKRYELQCK